MMKVSFKNRAIRAFRYIRLNPFDTNTEEGRSAERHRRVVLSALTSSISRAISIATGLITVPIALHYLGAERYGLWMTISSVITMLTFADLGIGNGLVNAVSGALSRDDTRGAAESVSSAFGILSAVAALFALLFAAVHPAISWSGLFNVVSDDAVREAGPAVAVFVACFLLNIPLGIVQRVQMGAQEAYLNSLWMIAGQLLALGAVLAAIRFQAGLPVLVLALSGTPILVALLNGIDLFGRRRRELRPRISQVSWRSARAIMGEGGWFFALQIIATCHYAADNIIIARVLGPGLGPEEVSRYAVVMKLALLFPVLTSMWLTPLWPAASEAMGRGDWTWIKRTFKFALYTSTLFNGIGGLFLILFGRPIFHLWIGEEPSIPINLLLGFGLFLWVMGMSGPMAMFMNGLKVLRTQVILGIIMAIASVVARIHFAKYYGATGVITSNAVLQLLLIAVPSLFVLNKILKQKTMLSRNSRITH